MPNAVIHPSTQDLAAFALGKLPEAASTAIAGHLEKCPACRQAIEKLPADSFVGKVRAAKPDVSSLPARPGGVPSLLKKPAAPPVPPADLPPVLANYSKYRFVRELGRGGMGVVYQAEQTVMGRSVAVKVINPTVLDHPDALPRFQGEVKAAAKLDHPNIVRAHDAEQVGDMHLLVMEYVEGTSLAELVAKKGPQSIAHACHYIRQAALGLQHAFEQGMVHRDIKPQNLMVNARGQVKILDFGLARMRSERNQGGGLTQADAFMGTPEYVSPEQATDARSADTRADIYSLGCTLFFLLTGRPPFQEDTIVKMILAQIEKEPPALCEVRADVPVELSAVVARMLAKDPARRFQTPLEVAQELTAFVKAGMKRPSAGVSTPAPDVSSPGTGTAIAADTSKIKAILRDVPGKVPAQEEPAKDKAAQAFEGLGEGIVSAKKAKPARKAAKPMAATSPRSSRRKWLIGSSVAVGVLLLALLGMWASGVFKVKTKDGMIVLENLPPDADVLVDGGAVTVKSSDGKTFEVHVAPGKKHRIQVKKEGFKVFGEEVEVDAGGGKPLLVRLEKLPEPIPPEPPLPPEKQVEAVVQKLRDRNPGFDGAVKPTIKNGNVMGLRFMTDQVTDLSPLRVLPHLKWLSCSSSAPGKGRLADLSPLKGMRLTSLACEGNQVADLSPLEGMPLEHLDCINNPVKADLSPLKGMPLKELYLWDWKGRGDLSPLKGMSLTGLNCGSNWVVEDLSPLAGMPLSDLCLNYSKVSDLSPLKGMPLKRLLAAATRVSDLTPLKGMPLSGLFVDKSRVTDLTPIRELPLTELACDFKPERDTEILRSIKTLEKINYKPAAQFWKEVGGKIKELSPAAKSEAVARELKVRNPGFEGKWAKTPGIEGGKIVSLVIESGHVRDLTPLQALPHLRQLTLHGTKVTDLTPLQGLPLSFLHITYSPVSDLSPLSGMKELEELHLVVAHSLTDLKPLQGLKLRGLTLHATRVEDLSPLKGMPLKLLNIHRTRVKDLSPLKGMKLEVFVFYEQPVKDISVLKDMPLRDVACNFQRERDEAVLRSLKTLKKINGKPAAQFWKEVDGR